MKWITCAAFASLALTVHPGFWILAGSAFVGFSLAAWLCREPQDD